MSCLICLSDSDEYIILDSCSCKMDVHEKCYKEFVDSINSIKCMICKTFYKVENFDDNIIKTFVNSFFFFLQNLYFYFDERFLSDSSLFLRTVFAVFYHSILLVLTNLAMVPYLLISYLIYKIKLRKPYKIYYYKIKI